MKLKALFVAALIVFATSAFAQWFPSNPRVSVLPGQVSAEVFNPYAAPIICNGQVFGRTIQGQVFTSYFIEQLLLVGGYRYALVQTTPYAPFVAGWANINCRFF